MQNLTQLFTGQKYQHWLTRRYDQLADGWHAMLGRLGYLVAYRDLVRYGAPHLPSGSAPLTLLDAGAGSGGFSLAFCQEISRPVQVDLLDRSQNMLHTAAELHYLEGRATRQICADIADLDPAQKTYDVILCAHVIEHCPKPEAALKQLKALLKPGGIMLLSVSKPHWCTLILQMSWHHPAFRPARIIEMLSRSGFARAHGFGFSNGAVQHTSHGYVATLS